MLHYCDAVKPCVHISDVLRHKWWPLHAAMFIMGPILLLKGGEKPETLETSSLNVNHNFSASYSLHPWSVCLVRWQHIHSPPLHVLLYWDHSPNYMRHGNLSPSIFVIDWIWDSPRSWKKADFFSLIFRVKLTHSSDECSFCSPHCFKPKCFEHSYTYSCSAKLVFVTEKNQTIDVCIIRSMTLL